MTKKGLTRLSLTLVGTAGVLTIASLAIAYGIPNVAQSKNHLRTVVNASNSRLRWHYFDKSASYGSILKNDFAESVAVQALVRKAAVGEREKIINYDNPVNEQTFLKNLKDSPYKYHEFLRLELAQAIVVFQGQNYEVFDNDDYNQEIANISESSINSSKFQQLLADKNTTRLDFIIRSNVPWVNHRGQVVKDATGKPYYVEPKDWLYGIYRMGMTNNMWRHSPVNENNPFGGFGTLKPNISLNEWTKKWTQLSTNLQIMSAGARLVDENEGFSNSYLYDMLNVQNPTLLVKKNAQGIPNILGTFHDQKRQVQTVSFNKQSVSKSADFKIFFNKQIIDSTEIIAAPSRYIDEVASKIDRVGNVELPSKEDKDIESNEEINIRKYAQFTYGTTYDKTLYATPYYVSESNGFRNKFEINNHYWDTAFVKRTDKILSYTEDFIEISDKDVFYQSLFDQYNNDRIYTLDPQHQSNEKREQILSDPQKYGLRYENPIKLEMPNNLVSAMLPYDNYDYYYDNNFAKIWFGAPLDDIKQGKMLFNQFINPWTIAARSQIFAAINWYTQLRTINPMNKFENWYSYFPPDSAINAKDSDKINPVKFSHYKQQLNVIKYWIVNEKNQLEPRSLDLEDNIRSYNADKTQQASIRSAHFDQIKKAFKPTVDEILQSSDPNLKITFQIRNRFLNPSPMHVKLFEQFVDIFKALDSRFDPVLKISNLSEDISDYHFRNKSMFQSIGWGPDYDGAGTWITGLNRNNTSISTLALALASDQQVSALFPRLTQYGNFLNQQINNEITDYFQSRGAINLKNQVFKNPLEAVKSLTNQGKVNLSSSEFIKSVLLRKDIYNALTVNEKMIIDQANETFKKVLAGIDLKLQTEFTEQDFIELSQEYSSLVGWGFNERYAGIPNKSKFQEIIWKPWLIWPKPESGIIYLNDLRIDDNSTETK